MQTVPGFLLSDLLFTTVISFIITRLVYLFNFLLFNSYLSTLKISLSCLVLSVEIKIVIAKLLVMMKTIYNIIYGFVLQ